MLEIKLLAYGAVHYVFVNNVFIAGIVVADNYINSHLGDCP